MADVPVPFQAFQQRVEQAGEIGATGENGLAGAQAREQVARRPESRLARGGVSASTLPLTATTSSTR